MNKLGRLANRSSSSNDRSKYEGVSREQIQRVMAPSHTPEHSILVVEDDRDILELISLDLQDLGIHCESASDGRAGLEKALEGSFDLVVLDVMLPKLDGLEICRKLREAKPDQAIMILTAKGDDVSLALGFERGADEYLKKPFKSFEFKARVQALLRRTQRSTGTAEASQLTFGALLLDLSSWEASIAGRPLELTKIEFDILHNLMLNPGKVVTRDQLFNMIWGEFSPRGYELNLNTHISRLRTKLKSEFGTENYITTIRGVGYRFIKLDELPKEP